MRLKFPEIEKKICSSYSVASIVLISKIFAFSVSQNDIK